MMRDVNKYSCLAPKYAGECNNAVRLREIDKHLFDLNVKLPMNGIISHWQVEACRRCLWYKDG